MTNTDSSHFRKDIQGLRGIAVLLVVIYHTGIGLPGGFVGVDMFFVISGFVITQLLVRELEQTGTIRFRNFYARRARRLLPALALVTVVTLGFSVLALSPFGEQQQVAKTGQATTLFLANAYMFLENTYFSLQDNPFRHMWSLAVEEQFYLVFPLALLIGWNLTSRLNKEKQRVALVIGVTSVSIISFVGGALLSFGYRITPLPERFAFFGTPSRIWEFGFGVLVALVPLRGKLFKNLAPLLFVGGVGAVAWSATQLESFTPFPGVVALAPVVGTALLIIAGQNLRFSEQILSWRPIVALGDISYGWYLWHWPLIVFVFRLWPGNTFYAVLAAVASLVPTLASYRWLEQPIRRSSKIIGRRALRLAAVCVVVPVFLSFIANTAAQTHLGLTQPEVAPRAGVADNCGFTVDSASWMQNSCTFRVVNSKGKIFLFGDSQARALADGVIKAGNSLGYDVAVLATAGCPMTSGAPLGVSWCEEIQSRLFELVDGCVYFESWKWDRSWCEAPATQQPVMVVIGNSSTRYIGDEYRIPFPDGRLPTNLDDRIATVVRASKTTLDLVVASGIPTLVIHEVPSVVVNANISLLRPKPIIEARSLTEQITRNKLVVALDEQIKFVSTARSLDPASIVCSKNRCEPSRDGKIIYYDSSHLNVLGSELLAGSIAEKMKALLG